jgi:hypothetical protein
MKEHEGLVWGAIRPERNRRRTVTDDFGNLDHHVMGILRKVLEPM